MVIILWIHIIACVMLIGLILIQRGRGGGFVDSFSNLESMFGTKTSSFLTKLTTGAAITFFLTCLILTGLSLKQSRSLMHDVKIKSKTNAAVPAAAAVNATASAPAAQAPVAASAVTEQKAAPVEKAPATEKAAEESKPAVNK